MKIAGNCTIATSEQALIELAKTTVDQPLQLPTRIRHAAGGAEAALTQLIVTWAQKNDHRKIATYIKSPEDPQIDNFVRKLPGITAALCADEISGSTKKTDITSSVTRAAIARLEQLSSSKPASAFRGPSAEIICADHIARGTPYLLYQKNVTGGGELRSRGNFRSLAAWLLKKSIPQKYRETFDAEKLGDAIGGMLYEAFKNTEDHALVNERGDVLKTSIRAIKTNRVDIEPGVLVRILEDFPPLAEYCQSLSPDGGVQTHFFELSVIDSGPGFASTWTNKPLNNLSYEEEEQAVRQCFGHGSAKQRDRFGEGLPHVLRILEQEKGFLKLRTGRLSFYINYAKSNTKKNSDLLQLYTPKGDKLAPVSGSLLTIILPLRGRQ